MKIYIDKVPEEGLQLNQEYDPSKLGLEGLQAIFVSPIMASARATTGGDSLLVKAQVKGQMKLACARCLEEFESPIHKELDLQYKIASENFIDITDDIRQELMLDLPLKSLCREDCKGLCPICGQNLNEGPCKCSEEKT